MSDNMSDGREREIESSWLFDITIYSMTLAFVVTTVYWYAEMFGYIGKYTGGLYLPGPGTVLVSFAVVTPIYWALDRGDGQ